MFKAGAVKASWLRLIPCADLDLRRFGTATTLSPANHRAWESTVEKIKVYRAGLLATRGVPPIRFELPRQSGLIVRTATCGVEQFLERQTETGEDLAAIEHIANRE